MKTREMLPEITTVTSITEHLLSTMYFTAMISVKTHITREM